MSTYLITGCSQGLGPALVQRLLSYPSSKVALIIATTRSATPNSTLQSIFDSSSGRVHFVTLDVLSDSSVSEAAKKSAQILGDRGLDCLINNAALGASCTSAFMGDVDNDMLTTGFATNAVGVHRVTKAFLPLCRTSQAKQIVNVSSTQGSCGRALIPPQSFAHAPDYKVSKAALNMITLQWAKSLAEEGFTVMAISPGHLQTQLGTGKGVWQAELTAETGAEKSVDIVMGLTREQNATFRNIYVEGHDFYKGEEVPW